MTEYPRQCIRVFMPAATEADNAAVNRPKDIIEALARLDPQFMRDGKVNTYRLGQVSGVSQSTLWRICQKDKQKSMSPENIDALLNYFGPRHGITRAQLMGVEPIGRKGGVADSAGAYQGPA